MSLRIFCFAMIAFGLAAPAANAATITAEIVLLDADTYDPLPTSGANTYMLSANQQFVVQLRGIVNNPNITDTLRTGASMDGKALGIANVAGQLVTTGNHIVFPQEGAPAIVGQLNTWKDFQQYIPTGGPGYTNVDDVDNDGDKDPTGAGAANSSLSLSPSSSLLAAFQHGALGQVPFFDGLYAAGGSTASSVLSFIPGTLQVFNESQNAADFTAVDAQDIPLAGFSVNSVTINVVAVPEPSTFALAGLGLVGLVVAARRRKTA